MTIHPLNERGLTLTEVTIVAAIGLLVLLGLGGFYLNSQSIWLDASSQSITQREATLVTETIADDVRGSALANVTNNPDANHVQLSLTRQGEVVPFSCFWWDAADSLVHSGTQPVTDDQGPMLTSKVELFQVTTVAGRLVVTRLRVRSATGQRVEVTTSAFMRNHP